MPDMTVKPKIRTLEEALERFDVLCASVESELESMDNPFAFTEGEEEGEMIARPIPPRGGAECLIALDGFDGVTISWIVNECEKAAEAADIDDHSRVAEWMVQQLEGGILQD